MARAVSARRYAQAVFRIAQENEQFDEWADDLNLLADAAANEDVTALLNSPQIPQSRKIEIVDRLLGDSVGPLAKNLLGLLATRSVTTVVVSIRDEYETLLNSLRGIERAEVTTAIELDDEQKSTVASILEAIVGKQIQVSTYVEPDIIGGLIARVNDQVIDGSIRARLRNMHQDVVGQIS